MTVGLPQEPDMRASADRVPSPPTAAREPLSAAGTTRSPTDTGRGATGIVPTATDTTSGAGNTTPSATDTAPSATDTAPSAMEATPSAMDKTSGAGDTTWGAGDTTPNATDTARGAPDMTWTGVDMPPQGGWSATRLGVALAVAALVLGVCGLAAGSTGWIFTGSADGWLVAAIRAPRTLGAFCAGGLLGLAGAIAQGVFRNPLAEPSLLGSSTGATLGIVMVLATAGTAGAPFGMASGQWLLRMGLVSAGFAGALIGVSLTLVLAGGGRRPTVLLLAGVVVGVLLGAIANLMMLVSPEALRGGQAFMLGSTGFLGWHALAPLAVVLCISLPIAVRYSRALDALVLGEATAQSLGVAVPRVRLLLVALMALCTGTAVAETGLVAFVGLVAPHLVRRSVIVTHGGLLVLAALAGGVLLLGADVVARSVLAPQELPVGLLTTILGGMYLLVLLHRRAADDQR